MEVQVSTEGRQRPTGRQSTADRPAIYVSKRPALNRALAGLTRELRSPLATLSLILELMKADERVQAMAPTGRAAAGASVSAETLSRQIVALLEDLRETGNPFGLRPGLADLSVVVQRAISARHPVAEARRLHVSVDALAPLVVNGDARLLVKAIGDLLDLVMRHAPDGAGIDCIVELEGDHATIALTCRRTQGSPPNLVAALYPFRGPSVRVARLEPWLSRHIIEHHGGSVIASSMQAQQGFGLVISLPGRLA